MLSFTNLFSVYEATDAPPILTEGYRLIKNNYNLLMADLNFATSDADLEDTFQVQYPIEQKTEKTEFVDNTTSSPSRLNGNFRNIVISYFKNKGLSEAQARGIYGNLMLESAGKLDIISRDGHNSYGIALWTGNRKLRLFSMYGNRPTLLNQLDYLWWELNNTEKSALDSLQKTSTIAEATKSFMKKFERPHVAAANYAQRLKFAMS